MAMRTLKRETLDRIRANVAEALWSLRRGDYWVLLFVAAGTMATGLCLLWPGATMAAYPVWLWISEVPDAVIGLPMLGLGLWALMARGPSHRRIIASALAFAWCALAIVTALSTYHVVTVTDAGPSIAPVHYFGWAWLSLLLAARASEIASNAQAEPPEPGPPGGTNPGGDG